MKSLILQTSIKLLFPLLIIASILSLLRGHNLPGGGFIGGLVAASAFILDSFTMGVKNAKHKMHIKPFQFIVTGLGFVMLGSLLPLLLGFNFLESIWIDISLPLMGKPGTPFLFDTGVYLIVIGAVCKIIFAIGDYGSP